MSTTDGRLPDEPGFYEDIVSDAVRVLTYLDADSDTWTTVVLGGRMDGWRTSYREDADPVVQHCKAIEAARRTRNP